MAEVIPNFVSQYDIDDLLKLVYPREFLIVSTKQDKYARDAEQMYLSASQAGTEGEREGSYTFKEFEGEHPLNQERFDFILNWFEERF